MIIYLVQYLENNSVKSVQINASNEREARKKFNKKYNNTILSVSTIGNTN